MTKIEKQLQSIVKICELHGESSKNPEYMNMLRIECETALAALEGSKEDAEFEADTEYYMELVA
jgi:hypothetical protein